MSGPTMPSTTLGPPRQPTPLRVLAACSSVVALVVGALPQIGVVLAPNIVGWITGVVGALSAVAVALLGERQVTPIRSPRGLDGAALVSSRGPYAPTAPPVPPSSPSTADADSATTPQTAAGPPGVPASGPAAPDAPAGHTDPATGTDAAPGPAGPTVPPQGTGD